MCIFFFNNSMTCHQFFLTYYQFPVETLKGLKYKRQFWIGLTFVFVFSNNAIIQFFKAS